MGGLFTSLQTASTALGVFSQALGVDEANVANASTPGYAAQRASVNPIDLAGTGSSTGDFITISSSGNSFLDAAVRAASSQASDNQTQAEQLSPVNQLFDITGNTGILAAFQQFSTAFSNLSASPNDPTLGAAALTAAGNVASAFNSVASGLATERGQVDSGIQTTTSQINTLAGQIRQLNVQAAGETQIDASTGANLRSDLDQLSSLVDINVTTNADGSVNVLAGGQLPLVIGDQSYTLSANPSAAEGSQISSSGGGNSPATFSGQLGALLQVRNVTIDPLLGSNGTAGALNTLATGFAARVNTLLSSGVTTSGAAGVPIFTLSGSPAGAASSLALDPSVTAAQLGLGTTGAGAESNGIANQLAGLAGSTNAADQIGGISSNDYFAAIAASVGQQLSDANTLSTASQTTLTEAQTNRQQATGVSLDQEAATITTWQRSYQASAQVVTILNQLTEDEINLIGPTAG